MNKNSKGNTNIDKLYDLAEESTKGRFASSIESDEKRKIANEATKSFINEYKKKK